jgi:hypothetical protein
MVIGTSSGGVEALRRLAARSHEHQHGHAATRFERRAEDARQQARIIRQVLTEGTTEAV